MSEPLPFNAWTEALYRWFSTNDWALEEVTSPEFFEDDEATYGNEICEWLAGHLRTLPERRRRALLEFVEDLLQLDFDAMIEWDALARRITKERET